MKRLFVWLLAGCHASTPALVPSIASSSDAGTAKITAADAGFVKPTMDLRVSETCNAPPIPRDAGMWTDDGGLQSNVRFEVPYGTDIKQTLDVVWPERGDAHPIVAIIHGGGWTSGDKHMFHPTMRALVDRGYVAATINYRFARDEARAFPTGIDDTRCALAYLVEHARELHADANRMVLIGASAGGHIAALIGVDPDAWGCRDTKIHVSGVISYYAPLDLRDIEERYPPRMQMAVWEFLRADAGSSESKIRATLATPATHVDENDPPFLLIHGSADSIVPVDDSRGFQRVLDAHHVPSLLVELDGKEHGFPVLSRQPEFLRATCSAWDFLDRVFARELPR